MDLKEVENRKNRFCCYMIHCCSSNKDYEEKCSSMQNIANVATRDERKIDTLKQAQHERESPFSNRIVKRNYKLLSKLIMKTMYDIK